MVSKASVLTGSSFLITMVLLSVSTPAFADGRFGDRGYSRHDYGWHNRGWDNNRNWHNDRDDRHHARYPSGKILLSLGSSFFNVTVGNMHLFYQDGCFYERRRHYYVAVPPPRGVLITTIPQGYSRIIINNVEYYNYQGVYYRRLSQGYEVVEAPIAEVVSEPVLVTPQVPPSLDVTVNIPNNRGGFLAVTLRKSGTGYVGPQGEFYPEFPKIEQLRVIYVK